uniref:Uncharacterized protein n=1 Tax=Manihot esculenta TaxID=3983 RepID=A0A2C9WBY8_MANES
MLYARSYIEIRNFRSGTRETAWFLLTMQFTLPHFTRSLKPKASLQDITDYSTATVKGRSRSAES